MHCRPASTLGAEIFREDELHVPDVVPRPQRLKDEVGEAEDGQVLDQLLAQIMVNPAGCIHMSMFISRSRVSQCVLCMVSTCLNICSSAKYFFRDRVSSPEDSESRPNGFSTINLVHPVEEDAVRLADLTTSTNMLGGIDK
jgi:hypothetical protein